MTFWAYKQYAWIIRSEMNILVFFSSDKVHFTLAGFENVPAMSTSTFCIFHPDRTQGNNRIYLTFSILNYLKYGSYIDLHYNAHLIVWDVNVFMHIYIHWLCFPKNMACYLTEMDHSSIYFIWQGLLLFLLFTPKPWCVRLSVAFLTFSFIIGVPSLLFSLLL